MSHFLCGEVELTRDVSWEELNALSFLLARTALDNELYAFVGQLPQHIAYEILGRRPHDRYSPRLPFFITASPILPTSDDVISPEFDGHELDARYSELRTQLTKVAAIVRRVLENPIVRSVTLTFSEGFSPEYREIAVSFTNFVDECLVQFKREAMSAGLQDIVVPLIRVRISRD